MSNSPDEVRITEGEGGIELSVKVVPGSSRSALVGVWQGGLRLAVTAPPEAGRANNQVVRLLAGVFGVRRGQVAITHGQSQPQKRVNIAGLSAGQAHRALVAALGSSG